jgi:hypothetical protein
MRLCSEVVESKGEVSGWLGGGLRLVEPEQAGEVRRGVDGLFMYHLGGWRLMGLIKKMKSNGRKSQNGKSKVFRKGAIT